MISRNRKRLWVVSELYYPEQTSTGYFLTKIAEGLASEYDVQVLCGKPSYSERGIKASHREDRNGTSIHRLRSTHFDKDRLFLRAINSISLTVAACVFALGNFRKGDRVLIVTNPPTLPPVLGLIARRKGMKSYLLVHDVYPEVLVATDFLKPTSFIYRALERFYSLTYQIFDQIIVLGRDMKQLVQHKANTHQQIAVIPNWGDIDEITPVDRCDNIFALEHALTDKCVIQFSGNIGRTHDIGSIISAAQRLSSRKDILFLFVGYGGKTGLINQAMSDPDQRNILFLPRQPRELLGPMLACSDATIISFEKSMLGISVPSRMYNIMSAATPIIAMADPVSELAQAVSQNGAGWIVPQGDVDALVEQIISIADAKQEGVKSVQGHNGRNAVIRDYSLESVLEKYRSLLS
ncbi:MAG: glycosyltransferase family 4 protein [Parasphingorhabdus sp.]